MNSIIIVDSDPEECEFLKDALLEAGAADEFRCFNTCMPALEYLRSGTDIPLGIIADIDPATTDECSCKQSIIFDKVITKKHIPLLFFSASLRLLSLWKSPKKYLASYFQKPDNMTDMDIMAFQMKQYLDKVNFKS
jgi:DNA-binding NtrC family response regulator